MPIINSESANNDIESENTSWTTLTYDTFEQQGSSTFLWGNFTDGGGDCLEYTNDVFAYNGSNAINLQDNAYGSYTQSHSFDLDTPGYKQISIDFWAYYDNIEPGEYLEISFDIFPIWRYYPTDGPQNQFIHHTLIIKEIDVPFDKNVKIKIESQFSDNNDDAYIDQIYINASTQDPSPGVSVVYVSHEFNSSTPGWNYDHFKTIQQGIFHVDSNGTVYVSNGTYYEWVFIKKPVTLIGENKTNTIIDADGDHNVALEVWSDYADISQFTIQHSNGGVLSAGIILSGNHSNIHNNLFKDNEGIGLYLSNWDAYWQSTITTNNTIENNTFMNNFEMGLAIEFGKNNRICNNTFNNDGLYILPDFGNQVINNSVNNKPLVYLYNTSNHLINNAGQVLLYYCQNITIKDTNLSDTDWGIFIYRSNHCLFDNNTITNNFRAGFIIESHNNTISNNTILDNYRLGIECHEIDDVLFEHNYFSNNRIGLDIDDSWEGNFSTNNLIKNNTFDSHSNYGLAIEGFNNRVYHNIFINNQIHAYDNRLNYWDNGYPSGGNYWEDYIGQDTNNDGIGDTPYNISGGGNKDHYPFMKSNGWLIKLDVNQNVYHRGFPIRHAEDGDWGAAQSFKPTLSMLTHISLLLVKFGEPEFDLLVELREDSVDGPLLEIFNIPNETIDNEKNWINIDISNISVIPGNTYFIVLPPPPNTLTKSFGYEWGYAFGNQYDDGSFWFTRNGGNLWRDLPTMYEFAFRIYGCP